ncbi:MAG: ABC transporter ATP-binding protein [Candidatus Gracilibacteria bacterium]
MKNAYFQLIKTAWTFAEGRRGWFVLAYGMFTMANIVAMAEPLILGLFLNEVQLHGLENEKKILLYLLAYPGIQLLFWLFHGNARVIERINAYHILDSYRRKLFDLLSSLPLKWHKNNHSGGTMSRLEKGSGALRNFVEEGFQYIETVVRFFASAVALFFLSTYAGLVALALGLVCALVIFRFDKQLIRYNTEMNEDWHKYDASFYDYVVNMRTVITLRLEKLAKKETVKRFLQLFPTWKKNAKVNELKWFFLSMVLAGLSSLVMLIYLYQQWASGTVILIGTTVALYEYAHRFTNVFFDVAWKYEQLVRYNTNLKSVGPIWEAAELLGSGSGVKPISSKWKRVEIRELSFRYEDEKHRTHNLKDVHLVLERGKKIALVGESGSGKSTLLALLRGLEVPDHVKVVVDGKELGLRALSGQMTLIPQDPEIFENTIEYNVTAGISHRASEISDAIRLARFDTVVKRLPRGLDTNIKEKGVNLSGGEKQRLALARGIFAAKDSSFVLLDEPTSSVDTKNEVKIYESLFEHFKDRCIISTIHRLHLLPEFDKIYLFEQGELKAEGSFDDLLKHYPPFQKMWAVYQKALNRGFF